MGPNGPCRSTTQRHPSTVPGKGATAGRPTFAALKKLLGRFRPVPRNPDDFRSGPRFAHYFTPKGSKTTVRVFAELTRSKQRVVNLFLDAYTDSK